MRYWRNHLPGSKDMAVIISGGSLEERRAAARELGKSFLDHPDHLEAVLSALPTDVFVSSGLYFLPQETLKTIDQDSELALKGTRSIDLSRQPNLDYLTEELAFAQLRHHDLRQASVCRLHDLDLARLHADELRLVPAAAGHLSRRSMAGASARLWRSARHRRTAVR